MKIIKQKTNFPDAASVESPFYLQWDAYQFSRYKNMRAIYDEVYRLYTVYTEDMKIVVENEIPYLVKADEENRLDIIAQRVYGDARLYWLIAYYNDIYDPMDVPVDTTLNIPSKISVFYLGGTIA